jgi:O-acetyl-ADP-ribose deacetylase
MAKIEVVKEDITKLDVDAIVNAANNSLLGGGGVDGAIHKAGGPAILEACEMIRREKGGCLTGEAVITTGGNLKARYVIHTVGPVWRGGDHGEDELLRSAYLNSFRVAVEKNVVSVAFSNISTGVYGFPKGRAAEVAISAAREFLNDNSLIRKVIFCCFDDENYKIYRSLLDS